MDKTEVQLRLLQIGCKQIRLRCEIGKLQDQIKVIQKELKETEKEVFALRSTPEYEELYKTKET